MSPVLTTFLFELINVFLLAAVLGWLFFKPVRAALQTRQEAERQRELAVAGREAEVARQQRELDARLQAVEVELEARRQQRLEVVGQEVVAIRQAALDATAQERARAVQRLAQLEHAQLQRLASVVAAVAAETVGRLLARVDGPELDEALARAACRELALVDPRLRSATLVEAAHPLTTAARAALHETLTEPDALADVRLVPELGVGMRIVTSQGVIDASAQGLARDIEHRLAAALVAETSEAPG